MILAYVFIAVALTLLFAGAEMLVKGSASLAARAGLTPLVIGLTVVAFGTSSPELAVSLKAAFAGQGDVAVGNVVGSNILNIALILGLAAVIFPITVHLQLIKVDVPIMIIVSILLPVLLRDGVLGRGEGGVLFAGIIVYTFFNVMMARKGADAMVESEFAESVPKLTRHWSLDLLLIGGGLAVLVVGSRLLVDNSIEVARAYQISEAVIGSDDRRPRYQHAGAGDLDDCRRPQTTGYRPRQRCRLLHLQHPVDSGVVRLDHADCERRHNPRRLCRHGRLCRRAAAISDDRSSPGAVGGVGIVVHLWRLSVLSVARIALSRLQS